MNAAYPVLLCGGSGTRLWPLSRKAYPKQFMDLGNGKTLFKDTLKRASMIAGLKHPLVICNETHRFYAQESLADCGIESRLLIEPAPRNTAPAVALGALAALELEGDSAEPPLLLIMPADHAIGDNGIFAESVQAAIPLAAEGMIVTFGVEPDSPETGYGYIKSGESLAGEARAVERFVEKPSLESAAAMLAQGGFFWNSGIFLLRADIYLAELERYAPEIAAHTRASWEARTQKKNFVKPGDAFLQNPAISLDYAVMERTRRAAVIPLKTRWRDLGVWESFYQVGEKDQDGNVSNGDILAKGASNCYLHSSGRLVAALDVENLAVVETKDAVLVAPRSSLQQVKSIVESLETADRPECHLHTRVFRPWGCYENLSSGDRFQVKRITVNPGASLSLQMHHHRAEHWVVVSGTAEITNGESVGLFVENQSTYIPAGTTHRLKNPGIIPLVLIEIQSGSYLGEDDIVRFEDFYGRHEQG